MGCWMIVLDVYKRQYIIGEHGDSELAVWSGAQVAGIHINHFCELRGHFNHQEAMERLAQQVRDLSLIHILFLFH